jgi:hypothetical protein
MKKLLMFAMLMLLAIAATACSEDSEGTDEGNNTEENATEEDSEGANEEEAKAALLELQAEVVSVLREHDAPFGEFKTAKDTYYDETAEEKPTLEELEALMAKAEAQGPKAAEALRAIEVPSELSDYKEDITSALEDAAKSYEKRTENLTVENVEDAQKEAEELFASFEEKMGKVFKDLGLAAPSFTAELA